MVNSYVELLEDGDAALISRGLNQPSAAAAAWRAHMREPVSITKDAMSAAARVLSEKLVLYVCTRCSYAEELELTVDCELCQGSKSIAADLLAADEAAQLTHRWSWVLAELLVGQPPPLNPAHRVFTVLNR